MMANNMTPRETQAIAGSIGYPSKMPGTSYGISAHHCITGAKLVKVAGSTCHKCYALRGHYVHSNVAKAHEAREAHLGSPQWVAAMVTLLEHAHRKGDLPAFHRWHDSGDLQSVTHLAAIIAVCDNTPWLKHWLPTREHGIVQAFTRDEIPPNLTIRVSATMIDGAPTAHWPTTSTVHKIAPPKGQVCPAPTQGNKCADCRACWSQAVANVSYHQH